MMNEFDYTLTEAMDMGASLADLMEFCGISEEELFDEDEEDYEEDFDEMGFNPYMGCYDFDC